MSSQELFSNCSHHCTVSSVSIEQYDALKSLISDAVTQVQQEILDGFEPDIQDTWHTFVFRGIARPDWGGY